MVSLIGDLQRCNSVLSCPAVVMRLVFLLAFHSEQWDDWSRYVSWYVGREENRKGKYRCFTVNVAVSGGFVMMMGQCVIEIGETGNCILVSHSCRAIHWGGNRLFPLNLLALGKNKEGRGGCDEKKKKTCLAKCPAWTVDCSLKSECWPIWAVTSCVL